MKMKVKNRIKVAFRIDVSPDIGAGHFVRMSALADAFTALGSACAIYNGADEPIDYSGFDIIVLDSYNLSDEYISSLRKPGRVLVCYDDNALYTYDCDVLLNANFHANELCFNVSGMPAKLLLGPKYALLRSEFTKVEPIAIKDKGTDIFICFGGSDMRNFTPRAIETLSRIPKVKLTAVLGEYTKNDDEVMAFTGDKVKVLKSPDLLSSVMNKCDIAVTGAGSMVYELAALGIPSILISQADNQHKIADYLEGNNLMKWLGSWDSISMEDLCLESESLLKDFKRRKTEHNSLITTVNRNGALNAANEILDAYSMIFPG